MPKERRYQQNNITFYFRSVYVSLVQKEVECVLALS